MARKKKEDIEIDDGSSVIQTEKKPRGRKKKVVEGEKVYESSEYQLGIYDFIVNGHGNLVVEASAGSGKTYTIIQCIKLIDNDNRILFCAFNRDIVKEISKKVKGYDNVDVRTVHGIGYLMLQRNFDSKYIPIDEFKYYSHVRDNISNYSTIDLHELKHRKYFQYIENIIKIVDLARFNLIDSMKELNGIINKYNVETLADEAEIALQVLSWGKENIETIDYTDMIWLPNVLYLKPIGLQYDWIMLDECQDISVAQRELVLKLQKKGTRYIFTGDENQSIYGFNGSLPEQFEELKKLPNTTSLPLSISYRCPKNIVNFAKILVPSIEYNEKNEKDGEILYNVKLEDIEDGDMIICRNNAPLMKIYNDFIRMGRKCFIKGKDIGTNLKSLIKSTKKNELNQNLENDGVFVRLYSSLFDTRDNIMLNNNIDYDAAISNSIFVNKLDSIKALEVLAEGLVTTDELINRIDNTFSDKKKEGISLSTIHKAKGLEANNVYIACRSLLPSKTAVKDWEKQQEKNLMYVAYTRAKEKLGFIDENDFKMFNDENNKNSLKFIETQVNKVLGKNSKHMMDDKEYLKTLLKNLKPIEKPKTKSKVLETVNHNNINKIDNNIRERRMKTTFDSILNNRKKQ